MDNNHENTKRTILIVMGVITCIAIIVGLAVNTLRFTGFLSGLRFGGIKGLGKTVEDSVLIDESFDSVSIRLNLAEITVKAGDEAKIEYCLPEKMVPQISIEDGCLNIESKETNVKNFGDLMGVSSDDYDVVITVPKTAYIKNMIIDIACGNLNFEDYTLGDIKISVDCGNVELEDIIANSIDVNADLGNVEFDKITCKNDMTLAVDCGNIEVADGQMETVRADNSMGNIVLKRVTFKTGSFDNDMGNIDVDGDFEAIAADCSMGAIDIRTARAESELKLDLNVDMGDIKVNGKNWK